MANKPKREDYESEDAHAAAIVEWWQDDPDGQLEAAEDAEANRFLDIVEEMESEADLDPDDPDYDQQAEAIQDAARAQFAREKTRPADYRERDATGKARAQAWRNDPAGEAKRIVDRLQMLLSLLPSRNKSNREQQAARNALENMIRTPGPRSVPAAEKRLRRIGIEPPIA